MRKLMMAIIGVSILALPAHAQRRANQGPTPQEIEKQRTAAELDRQYKAALERTQSSSQPATAKQDPWANMRGPATNKQ